MLRTCIPAIFVILSLTPALAQAEVKASAENGFAIGLTKEVDASTATLYSTLLKVETWWHPDHTYTRESQNLYLEAKPKGWFGERLPDNGFVRHLEVGYLAPGKSLRLLGGLGPLQEMGLSGALTIKIATAGENASKMQWTYNVSGYSPADLTKLAPVVDKVLEQQVERLAAEAAKQQSTKR